MKGVQSNKLDFSGQNIYVGIDVGRNHLVFLIFILFSCEGNISKSTDKTVIPVAEAIGTGEILNLSNYAKSVKYVPLETTDDVLVGSIEKLLYEEGKIFLYDFEMNLCKQFDQEGNFDTFIGNIGQGPGEYTYVAGLDFIPETKEIS